MELFLLYFWLKLNILIVLLLMAAAGCGFGILCYAIARTEVYHSDAANKLPTLIKWQKKLAFWGIAALLAAAAIPSQTQTAVLIGASYAIDLAKSPEGQKVQSLIRKKVNDVLDAELKEAE